MSTDDPLKGRSSVYQKEGTVYRHVVKPPSEPETGVNPLAIGSLVFALIWLFWIGSLVAVLCGHIALNQCRRTGQRGTGLAVAGVVIGYVSLAPLVFIFMVAGVARS